MGTHWSTVYFSKNGDKAFTSPLTTVWVYDTTGIPLQVPVAICVDFVVGSRSMSDVPRLLSKPFRLDGSGIKYPMMRQPFITVNCFILVYFRRGDGANVWTGWVTVAMFYVCSKVCGRTDPSSSTLAFMLVEWQVFHALMLLMRNISRQATRDDYFITCSHHPADSPVSISFMEHLFFKRLHIIPPFPPPPLSFKHLWMNSIETRLEESEREKGS